MRSELPGGQWQHQGMREARIEGGVLKAQLLKRDGTWVDAQVNLETPALDNFNGVFVPSDSYAHLRALVPVATSGGGGDGLSTHDEVTIATTVIAAAAAVAAAFV